MILKTIEKPKYGEKIHGKITPIAYHRGTRKAVPLHAV